MRLGFLFLWVLCIPLACQATGRSFTDIVILESGANSKPSDTYLAGECKKFKPTRRQVREFFVKAYPAPHRFGLHERYSPCFASGTAQYSGFGQVNWFVNSGGFGSLDWGGEGRVYLFHKRNGWTDPAACTYGLSSEGEC